MLPAGPYHECTTAEMIDREGARLATDLNDVPVDWPVLHLGDTILPSHNRRVRLRVTWKGWSAHVQPEGTDNGQPGHGKNVLTAIAAAALGVHEAFGANQNRAGSDAGWRCIALNLRKPGSTDDGPPLAHAPAA